MPDSPRDAGGRRARSARHLLRLVSALAVGLAGAAAGKLLSIPLPFLLGPLIACAVLTASGVALEAFPLGREAGQVVVGLGIGLRFVPAVLASIVTLLPMMVVATLLTIASTLLAAVILRRLGRVDTRTAFFATAAAGLAEMAIVAHQKGADGSSVAVVHLLRVTTIVTAIPLLATLVGTEGAILPPAIALEREALSLAILFSIAAAAAFLAKPLRVPNSWLLVPAAIGAAVAASGLGPYAVPPLLLIAAQIAIGISLGCRFRRTLVARLPRVTLAGVVTTAVLIAAAAAIAWLVAWTTGLPYVTSLLAVAPAGVTEMGLTATAMHLDATTVTAFQLMRIAVVTTSILFVCGLFEALMRRARGPQ
jgi:uncharacterized protein